MDELVKLVTQKTGISQDQAKIAVETVIKFLKQKMPGPIAGQIDGFLSGGSLDDLAKKAGGLFNK